MKKNNNFVFSTFVEAQHEVLMYRRLQDDGILQALAASRKEAEALGERLATLLEEVDEEGKSIQIPRKDLKVVMVPWIEAPRMGEGGAAAAGAAGGGSSEGKGEQVQGEGIEYLDVWLEWVRDRETGAPQVRTSMYRKPAV